MVTKARAHKSKEASNRQSRGEKATRLSNNPAAALQRAHALPPSNLSAADIFALQRTVGNRAVEQLLSSQIQAPLASALAPRPVIQAKLMVGPAADHYEQEADRIARKVTSDGASESGAGSIRRQTDEEEPVQRKPLAAPMASAYQHSPSADMAAVEPKTESVIERARGGGQPLPKFARAQMERALGADFSGVRVHTDAAADHLNRSLQSRAFTTGQDLFFKRGEYNPGSADGDRLIAHELTHVVQQKGAQPGGESVRPGLFPGLLGITRVQKAVIQRDIKPSPKNSQALTDVGGRGVGMSEQEIKADSEKHKRLLKEKGDNDIKLLKTYYEKEPSHKVLGYEGPLLKQVENLLASKDTNDKEKAAMKEHKKDWDDLSQDQGDSLTKAGKGKRYLQEMSKTINEWELRINKEKEKAAQEAESKKSEAKDIVGKHGTLPKKMVIEARRYKISDDTILGALNTFPADPKGQNGIKELTGQKYPYELKFRAMGERFYTKDKKSPFLFDNIGKHT
jgi:uncharacterized protein DUF4157